MPQLIQHFYEFGPFRLEISERVLLRAGEMVPLTPKLFETLLALVEGRGHIVDKDVLLRRIWPDTFVEEGTLAKNVSVLRKMLGEENSAPRYIETISKRGYRFVAEVRVVSQASSELPLGQPVKEEEFAAQAQEPSPSSPGLANVDRHTPMILDAVSLSPSSRVSRWAWSAVFLMTGLVAGCLVWLLAFRPLTNTPAPSLKIIPFTSFPGRESQAAFSPDGDRIAFVWDGPEGNNQDLYVKLMGTETPLRLTTNPAPDSNPTWSPDGRYIAFFRQTAVSSGFYLIPALGGAERKLAEVFSYQIPATGNSSYYSPDGKYLAISDKSSEREPVSIFLLSLETSEKRKLTSPPAGMLGDYQPSFSPDGKWLAFVRSTSVSISDLYFISLSGGEAQQLTFDHATILGLSWTSDSREIVFASRRGSSLSNLWRIAVTGGAPERVTNIGQGAFGPAISRQNRLAYTQSVNDINIWRLEVDSLGRGQAPVKLISSSLVDMAPDYSPDGQRIVFASNRSGGFGLWVCDSDGANLRLLLDRGPYLTGTPHWSPDGRWIAFDSSAEEPGLRGSPDIFIISAEGGQPRRLTEDPAVDVVPSWSKDGRWIYFGSTRSGSMQIWKMPAGGGPAVQMTKQGGFEGFESSDGKYLYYTKERGAPGIWRIPSVGGEEKLVLDHHQAGMWRYWQVVDKGIYFVTAVTPSHPMIEFFNFATGQVTEIARLEKAPDRANSGLAVAPDGRHILYAQQDQSGRDIMLVETFH